MHTVIRQFVAAGRPRFIHYHTAVLVTQHRLQHW